MKYKVIEGNVEFIQRELNFLQESWYIKIKGVSTSPRDVQLGIGGIVVVFTLEPLPEKEELEKAYKDENKIITETKKPVSKPAPKPAKTIKRNKK